MEYGSGIYMISVGGLLLLAVGAWAVLRRCTDKVQRIAVFSVMLLNVLQHFLKPFLYPQYAGQGFSYNMTAYNLCALLIILSPVAYLWKNRFLRNFVLMVGAVAGLSAIVFPVWFIGRPVWSLQWHYGRFYICHALLFLSSVLPLALGHHRPSYKEFWQVGLAFLLGLCVILINDVLLICAGIYPKIGTMGMYELLLETNTCLMMGPPKGLPWLTDIIGIFSPSFFMGNNPAGQYVPILWYAIPLYLGITVTALLVFSAMDHKNLAADIQTHRAKHPRKP